MRGGTSKGIFFVEDDLPEPARRPGPARDALLLRVIGSPDPYGQQIDGLGGATSSTSKVVLVRKSARDDCEVEYLFGQVAVGAPLVDWSGNCGNLTAAIGPFSIARGLCSAPRDGWATVRLWQANIGKKIIAQVPMRDGEVCELGDFELDGVTFPAAEIRLEFLDPGAGGAMFPSGRTRDMLEVPGVGVIEATLIDAGLPTVFVNAAALGLTGCELQRDVNANAALLARCEAIRAHGAVAMGLAATATEASEDRPHTPKLAFVAPPQTYTAASGKPVRAEDVQLVARIVSMGKLHHAMTGTGAVALAAAAAVPGTLVASLLGPDIQLAIRVLTFGHPSGTLEVGAEARETASEWAIGKVMMSRSARRLMDGEVWVPVDSAYGDSAENYKKSG